MGGERVEEIISSDNSGPTKSRSEDYFEGEDDEGEGNDDDDGDTNNNNNKHKNKKRKKYHRHTAQQIRVMEA